MDDLRITLCPDVELVVSSGQMISLDKLLIIIVALLGSEGPILGIKEEDRARLLQAVACFYDVTS